MKQKSARQKWQTGRDLQLFDLIKRLYEMDEGEKGLWQFSGTIAIYGISNNVCNLCPQRILSLLTTTGHVVTSIHLSDFWLWTKIKFYERVLGWRENLQLFSTQKTQRLNFKTKCLFLHSFATEEAKHCLHIAVMMMMMMSQQHEKLRKCFAVSLHDKISHLQRRKLMVD